MELSEEVKKLASDIMSDGVIHWQGSMEDSKKAIESNATDIEQYANEKIKESHQKMGMQIIDKVQQEGEQNEKEFTLKQLWTMAQKYSQSDFVKIVEEVRNL